MRYAPRFTYLSILFLAMCFAMQPFAQGHDEDHDLDYCQSEDELGSYTFPIAQNVGLLELCNEVDGTVVLVADPGPVELVRQMVDFGLYDPYWLIEDIFFGDDFEEDSEE